MKVYFDTNVLLDYINNRSDHLRPLGLFAFECLSKGWNCAFELVYSEWNDEELKKYAKREDIDELLGIFEEKHKLIRVEYSDKEREKAESISSHWHDPLHLIIAEREKCDKLITRNVFDFPSSSKLDICFPENV